MLWHWLLLSLPTLLVFITTSHGAFDLFKCPTRVLKRGKVQQRSRGRVIKYVCARGFQILGDKYSTCIRGKWDSPTPFCISSGCAPISVANSQSVVTYRGALTTIHCDPGYTLVGWPALRCDGRVWNASAPVCQEVMVSSQTSCDFENEDLCGWTHDHNHDFDWQRHNFATPSGDFRTGPSFDHTLGQGSNGHYMYVESSSPRLVNDTARLFSPFFPTPSAISCFIFWYHMYGVSTGTLNVYLHGKHTVLLFSQSGDHGNQWTEAVLPLPFFRSSFQIVIEGVRGSGFAGDIAVDDVRLAQGEDCFPISTTTDNEASTLDNTDNSSCENRCHTVQADSTLCECTSGCVQNGTCCPDYLIHCSSPSDSTLQQETDPPTTKKLTMSVPNTQIPDSNSTDLLPLSHKKSSTLVDFSATTSPVWVQSSHIPRTDIDSNNTLTTSRSFSKTSTTPIPFMTDKARTVDPVLSSNKPVTFQKSERSETPPFSHSITIPSIQYKASTASPTTNLSSSKQFTIPTPDSSTLSTSTKNIHQNLTPTSSVVFKMSTHQPNSEQYFTRKSRFPVFTIVRSNTTSTIALPTYSTPSTAQSVTLVTNNQSLATREITKIVFPLYTIGPLQTTTTRTTPLITETPLVVKLTQPHLTSLKIKVPKLQFITPPPPIVYRAPIITQNHTTIFQQNMSTATTVSTLVSKYFKLSTKTVWKSRNDVLHPSWMKSKPVQRPQIMTTLNSDTTQSTSSTSRLHHQYLNDAKKYSSDEEPKQNKDLLHKVESEGSSPVHDQYAGAHPSKNKDIFTLVCVCLLFLSAVLVTLSVLRRRKINRNSSEYDELDIHFLPSDEMLDFTIARPSQSQNDCEIAESVR